MNNNTRSSYVNFVNVLGELKFLLQVLPLEARENRMAGLQRSFMIRPVAGR